jgi:mRNA interferase MazF
MNRHIPTVVVLPMTTTQKNYPTRAPCTFQATTGQVVLDQIRTADKTRLVKRLRRIDADTAEKVVRKLQEMVAL